MELMKLEPSKHVQPLLVKMDNVLKEFEELLLDKTLFMVQNQALGNLNPKWKEWW